MDAPGDGGREDRGIIAERHAGDAAPQSGRIETEVLVMIEVSVGKQLNGAVFGLTPKTEIMLRSRFPDWSPAPNSVFISYGRPWDFEKTMEGPMWTQIVMLLTRLTEQQIQELGGVTFVNPVSHEVFFESRAA